MGRAIARVFLWSLRHWRSYWRWLIVSRGSSDVPFAVFWWTLGIVVGGLLQLPAYAAYCPQDHCRAGAWPALRAFAWWTAAGAILPPFIFAAIRECYLIATETTAAAEAAAKAAIAAPQEFAPPDSDRRGNLSVVENKHSDG